MARAWLPPGTSSGTQLSPLPEQPRPQSSVPITQPTTPAPLPRAGPTQVASAGARLLPGARKWDPADEAGTGSVRLWFTGSDLFSSASDLLKYMKMCF